MVLKAGPTISWQRRGCRTAGGLALRFLNNQSGIAERGTPATSMVFHWGGPIRKNKTFFFFDLERVDEKSPVPMLPRSRRPWNGKVTSRKGPIS